MVTPIFNYDELPDITHFHLASPKINRCAKYNYEGHKNITESGFNAVQYCSNNNIRLFSLLPVFTIISKDYRSEKMILLPSHNIWSRQILYRMPYQSMAKMYGLNYTINRFFNVYGEKMDSSGAYTEVIFNWLNSIKSGNFNITIQGNPDEKVLDLVL